MYLFVYGTLRRTPSHRSGNSAHDKFLSQAIYCGTASIAGHLISLGAYPALIVDSNSTTNVKGEIYRIQESDLVALDLYEEIEPLSTNNEFQRVQKPITSDAGEQFSVWIYLLNSDEGDYKKYDVIESGDWCA